MPRIKLTKYIQINKCTHNESSVFLTSLWQILKNTLTSFSIFLFEPVPTGCKSKSNIPWKSDVMPSVMMSTTIASLASGLLHLWQPSKTITFGCSSAKPKMYCVCSKIFQKVLSWIIDTHTFNFSVKLL